MTVRQASWRFLRAIALVTAAAAIANLAAHPADRQPLLISPSPSAAPGVWPQGASLPAGGDWCDVKPQPPARPRGKYEYVPGARPGPSIA